MFTDRVTITAQAGRGGNGSASFRREKYIPRGGPDGGDGGRGGSVYVVSRENLFSLEGIQNRSVFRAGDGGDGAKKKKSGRNGEHCLIRVPAGTTVEDADTGEALGEILTAQDKVLVAAGGAGGRGNCHFATPQNRTPTYCEPGIEGESRAIALDLRLPSDVALVGMPQSGKSSLLAALTNARPRIGNYPFVTHRPMPGVCRVNDFSSFLVLDLPGLVRGSSEGQGVGNRFLKHLTRARILLFVLDAAGELPADEQADILRGEIEAYDPELLDRDTMTLINRCDLTEKKAGRKAKKPRTARASALTGEGIPELTEMLARALGLS